MKLVKSLLLASAAGLAAVSGASAADLGGIRKPAPAEYVRVCNAYGAGFFYIPGTQTCLRVGGRARFETEYQQAHNRSDGNTSGMGYRAIGRLMLDARTQSEYGPVRAFVRLDVMYRSGRYASGSADRLISATRGSAVGYAQTQTQVDLESAFIQFAGFTAGRLASFYDFGADVSFRGVGGAGGTSVNQLAYTATFGSGFSATLAMEDPINRRQGVAYNTYDAFGNYVNTGAASAAGHSYYGGNNSIPDFVGVLRVDQGWGSAQLSGVVHAVNYGYAANGANPDTDYGFAVQGGVKVNLPMLSPGDNVMVEAAYTQGVLQTVVSGYCGYGTLSICGIGKNGSFSANLPYVDAVYTGNAATGFQTKLTTAYGVTASFTHFWTPTLRSNLVGSWAKFDYSGATGFADSNLFIASTALIWSPIKDLDIGAEVNYYNVRGGHGAAVTSAGPVLTKYNGGGSSDDTWGFRLRVQRDF